MNFIITKVKSILLLIIMLLLWEKMYCKSTSQRDHADI